MPALIQHIDAIARQKERDVRCRESHPQHSKQWRAEVLSWRDAHNAPGCQERRAEDV
ncbi:MAG: hypothetical protein AB1437_17035 [Pseudomonadota bacterium]